MPYKLSAALAVAALALAVAAPANPFDCTVAKKPTKAGSVGVVNTETGEFTPSKSNPGTEERPHGAFVELQFGETTTSTFLHAPDGVLPPVREGGSQANCDGKGLDSLEHCFGG